MRFTLTGLTLTPVSVMTCATPAGPAADGLADAATAGLAAAGLPGIGRAADIWYVNLVYFTGLVRDPGALVDWVAARRVTAVTGLRVTEIQLARWRARIHARALSRAQGRGGARRLVWVVVEVAGVACRHCMGVGPGAAAVGLLAEPPARVQLEQMDPLAVQAAVTAARRSGWPGDAVFPFTAPGVAGADGQ